MCFEAKSLLPFSCHGAVSSSLHSSDEWLHAAPPRILLWAGNIVNWVEKTSLWYLSLVSENCPKLGRLMLWCCRGRNWRQVWLPKCIDAMAMDIFSTWESGTDIYCFSDVYLVMSTVSFSSVCFGNMRWHYCRTFQISATLSVHSKSISVRRYRHFDHLTLSALRGSGEGRVLSILEISQVLSMFQMVRHSTCIVYVLCE